MCDYPIIVCRPSENGAGRSAAEGCSGNLYPLPLTENTAIDKFPLNYFFGKNFQGGQANISRIWGGGHK